MDLNRNIFQKSPYVRIIIFLITGILLANISSVEYTIPNYVLGILLLSIFLLNRVPNFYRIRFCNAIIAISLMLFAYTYAKHSLLKNTQKKLSYDYYKATVVQNISENQNSYDAIIDINLQEKSKPVKAIAYFNKDSLITKLTPGSQFIFKALPQEVQNNGNPFEFDYKKYLQNQNIHYTVFINSSSIYKLEDKHYSIRIYGELIRNKLLNILRLYNFKNENYHIISALTLGYKKEISKDTKNYFASSGAMHILAVSGLHVGIIYMIFSFSLAFLKRKKAGKWLFVISIATIIWIYALITGLSPSVMRASTMFSFILIGDNLKRNTNIFNSLAASAILLLFINPSLVFSVGFQLSYLAVIGIVLFYPVIYHLVQSKKFIIDKLWSLTSVSISAQIATLPLGLYYFAQFPSYFWLSNIIAIPLATIILSLTLALLLLSPLPFVPKVLATLINLQTSILSNSLKWIDSLPYSTFQDIYLSGTQTIILIITIAGIYLYIKIKQFNILIGILVLIIGYQSILLQQNINLFNQEKLIIYNNKAPIIQIIKNRESIIFTDNLIKQDDNISRLTNNLNRNLKIKQQLCFSIADTIVRNYEYCIQKGNVINFNNQFIAVNPLLKNILKDQIITYQGSILKNINNLELSSLKVINIQRSTEPNNNKLNIHHTHKNGAYTVDLRNFND